MYYLKLTLQAYSITSTYFLIVTLGPKGQQQLSEA